MTKEHILTFLKNKKEFLSQNFGVRSIGLFGSYARNEATQKSDIDLVVDMPSSFENFFDLKYYLEENFKVKVDLIKEKNLRAFIKNRIQNELLYA